MSRLSVVADLSHLPHLPTAGHKMHLRREPDLCGWRLLHAAVLRQDLRTGWLRRTVRDVRGRSNLQCGQLLHPEMSDWQLRP
jgi:hypothetical protein